MRDWGAHDREASICITFAFSVAVAVKSRNGDLALQEPPSSSQICHRSPLLFATKLSRSHSMSLSQDMNHRLDTIDAVKPLLLPSPAKPP